MPQPGPLGAGQIRIDMRAASINYRDTLMLDNAYARPATGLIPCSDGAGEVTEIAPDVTRVKKGDRVALTYNPEWIGGAYRASASPAALGRGALVPGVMQEELVAHQSEAVLLPDHLSFEEGATYPCAGVTAWHALCGPSPLLPGATVLTQGSGGVSMFALQFAKMFGARVIATTSSPERAAKLKESGADETIDYRANPEWDKRVRELTSGGGADVTIEIGGAETFARSLASTRAGGRVAIIGLLTGRSGGGAPITASVDINMMRAGSRNDHEDMHRAIAFHKSRPVIDTVYGFDDLPTALHHLKSGKHMGKIVLSFK
jgi:NADPH:quinone reductase-like Zn-dependent oxidoreductase